MNSSSSITIVIVLSLATVLALALTILLTAGAVTYWQTSSHYQEILREKDASYWEHLGRTQTQGLHCEDQCKRLIDSSNHYYSTLIAAYDERLKSLLDTDVQSIQMREKSHREVLNIIHNQAVLVNQQTQTSSIECMNYCQALHSTLEACNNSLASLTKTNKHLMQRGSKQQLSIVYMHKLLMECESDKKLTSNYTFWFGGIIGVTVVAGCCCMLSLSSKRPVIFASKNELQATGNKENVEELTAVSNEGTRPQVVERVADKDKVSKRKDNLLEDSEKNEADKFEDSQHHMIDEPKMKLARTESKLSTMQSDYMKEQRKRSCLEDCFDEKEQCQEIKRKSRSTEKQKRQLVEEKQRVAIKRELATMNSYATAKEHELKQLKQNQKRLENHIKVLNARITEQNEKLLECKELLEQKTREKKQIQLELVQHKASLEESSCRVKELEERDGQHRESLIELEEAAILKDYELDMERESKTRALRGHECHKEKYRKSEVERNRFSTAYYKKPRPQQSLEEIRLEMYQEFEVQYKRFELDMYTRVAGVAEETGRLRVKNTEQQIQIKKLKSHNKALKQLAEERHTQARREEASERCRVTVDLPMVRHLSLSPPMGAY